MILSFFSIAHAYSVDPSGVILSDEVRDGVSLNNPLLVDFVKAQTLCPQGTRPPTIREFAQESMKMGAKGILELSEVTGEPPEGYTLIEAENHWGYGQYESFYYSSEGYSCSLPGRGCDREYFWTQSRYGVHPYVWYANSGSIYKAAPTGSINAVRCFSN